MNKNTWISAIVAFVLGFVVAWGIFGKNVSLAPVSETGDGSDATSTEEAVEPLGEKGGTPPSSASQTGEGSIVVSDQAAGDAVSLASVTLEASGWVAVREDRDGEPWNILGAKWFSSGTTLNEQVNLLRATTPGGVYYVEFRSDDGDRDFDIKKDLPFLDSEGKILRVSFETLPETSEAEL